MADLAVTAAEASFLDAARTTIQRLAVEVSNFDRRGYFDIGSPYGKQFEPIYDRIAELNAAAGEHLQVGSETMSEYVSAMSGLLRQVGRAQNDEVGALDTLTAAMSNPYGFLYHVAVEVVPGAVYEGTAAYAGEAYGYTKKKAGEAYDSFLASLKKYAVYGVGALALLAFAYGRGKR